METKLKLEQASVQSAKQLITSLVDENSELKKAAGTKRRRSYKDWNSYSQRTKKLKLTDMKEAAMSILSDPNLEVVHVGESQGQNIR